MGTNLAIIPLNVELPMGCAFKFTSQHYEFCVLTASLGKIWMCCEISLCPVVLKVES